MKSLAIDRPHSGDTHEMKWQEDIQMKGTTNPLYAAVHERRGSVRPQPNNTILYEVKKSETIASIAARFNITPTELGKLNRFLHQTLFPGQIIYVPDKPCVTCDSNKPDESINGQKSPRPGHVERVQLLLNKHIFIGNEKEKHPSHLAEELNRESVLNFLKIDVKYITDGEGVVSGVLLVTPNHLMFDPHVLDPLVIEHGVEKYGVVAPMHMIIRAALYPDIVRMKIKDATQTSTLEKKPELYHAQTHNLRKSRSHDNAFKHTEEKKKELKAADMSGPILLRKISETALETTTLPLVLGSANKKSAEETDNKSVENTNKKTTKDVKKKTVEDSNKTSTDYFTKTINESQSDSSPTSKPFQLQPICDEEDTSQCNIKKKSSFEKTKQKLQKGLRRFSITDGVTPSDLLNRRISLPSVSLPELKSKSQDPNSNDKKLKIKEPKSKQETLPYYTNMVEDKPELFASLEKLIPRPAKSFDDNPLYLCLRMGQPIKQFTYNRFNPVMDYGHRIKSEYWFSIPRSKVDNLYFFFLRWAPQRYGDIDNIDMEALGYTSIDENKEEITLPESFVPNQRRGTWAFPWRRRKSDVSDLKDSWELVSPISREPSFTESEAGLPELMNPSNILTEKHLKELNAHLPARAVGYMWQLIYSTAVHGFSLKSLYREMLHFDSPVLIIIANTTGAVFGAMLSSPLRLSDHFYGTGETFLFTFYPTFKCFRWSGENNYFVKGNTGSFAIGASDGQFGLWLDDDLYHGCTKECRTFNNACLGDSEMFVVKALEAWGFV